MFLNNMSRTMTEIGKETMQKELNKNSMELNIAKWFQSVLIEVPPSDEQVKRNACNSSARNLRCNVN